MIKIYLNREPWLDGTSFYLVEHNDLSGKKYLLQFENGVCNMVEVAAGTAMVKPTFRLNYVSAQEFLKEMAEIASEQGIKLESDLKREGKLEATERHLQDLQKLIFGE